MVSPEAIQALCGAIVREFHPDKVVLFGSYAWGQPDEASDVDRKLNRGRIITPPLD